MIDEFREQYPLRIMCRAMHVSESGYHVWRSRPVSGRNRDNLRLVELIERVHAGSRKTYGSPRIHAVLTGLGETCSKNKVIRLMQKHGIRAKTKKKFKATTDSKHNLPVAENILNRDFAPSTPNMSWAGDITYIWTREGWLYLAVVLDLYSRKVVGWSMDSTMSRELVVNALRMAIRARQPAPGLTAHSDRGSQYASKDFQSLLRIYEMVCSMSRKGNCWDNSVVESFFGTLKQEHVYFCDYATRDEATRSIFELIEGWYNRERLHSSLGNLSPDEYERQTIGA